MTSQQPGVTPAASANPILGVAGVDLGMSCDKVSVIGADGVPETICTSEGDRVFPSTAYVADDGSILRGDEALMAAMRDSKGFVPSLKDMRKGNPEIRSGVTVAMVDAHRLRQIAAAVRDQYKLELTHVLLSFPVDVDDQYRASIIKACELAKLGVLGMYSEPAAGQVWSQSASRAPVTGAPLGALNIGEWSTDFSIVVSKSANDHEVVRSAGLVNAGCRAFRELIRDLVIDLLSKKHGIKLEVIALEPMDRFHLDQRIRKTVEALSVRSSATVAIPAGGKVHNVEVTTAAFKDALGRFLAPVAKIIQDTIGNPEPVEVASIAVFGGLARNSLLTPANISDA
jgi:molecular chaperone DnaK (HSP70)